ncbi:MAG: DGQHR domain-containing protein DpdB [Myxococcota bacterium]|nr:DGQHR domain-containing protein DpdB [Myxococcota bacterium]
MPETITLPALALTQSPGRRIFAFGVDGKDVPRFAEVFRASRKDGGTLFGYQRHEVRRHIEEIRRYVESERPMIPNAVVLAFSPKVRFEALDGYPEGPSTIGKLHIPVSDNADEAPTGWIVDGQQRLTAIREANVDQFKMFAVGFIAADEGEQREQFILVNNTRPLPKSLIYELLPGVDAELPPALAKRRMPTLLVDLLNNTPGSPLYHVVRQHTNPSGRLRDNSLIKMLENSLSDGMLYRYRLTEPAETQLEGMARLLMEYWSAVKQVWGDIWELKPRQSRLLHGAGVVSLGFLMDAIAGKHQEKGWPTSALFAEELEKMKPHCRWAAGYWEFGPSTKLQWNEVQNTSKDVQMLANHLIRIYLRLPGEAPPH